MKKADIELIHIGLNTLSISLDTNWSIMNGQSANPEEKNASKERYHGMLKTLCFMGGDWAVDENGKHRVFLAGMSSQYVDKYVGEE